MCSVELATRDRCKEAHGLSARDCYPVDRSKYAGQCDEAEYALRKCLALHSCTSAARILYDTSAPRPRRVEANRALQSCLKQKHGKVLDCRGRP